MNGRFDTHGSLPGKSNPAAQIEMKVGRYKRKSEQSSRDPSHGRSQPERIYESENTCTYPNTESQRQDSDTRDDWVFPESTNTEFDILQGRIELKR